MADHISLPYTGTIIRGWVVNHVTTQRACFLDVITGTADYATPPEWGTFGDSYMYPPCLSLSLSAQINVFDSSR